MSKKAYVGVNGIARNVSNIYVGVNGVARKVVKGYVGVNGVAQQFWGGGSPTFPASWDYWKSVSGTIISFAQGGSDVYQIRKVNNKIAYYSCVYVSSGGANSYTPILISPDPDAVTFEVYDPEYERVISTYTYNGTFTDVNNITWYWSGIRTAFNSNDYDLSPNCLLNATVYSTGSSGNWNSQPAQDLLDKVYAVPFHEDYQTGAHTLNITDVRKTIRKDLGIFLAMQMSRSTDIKYQTLSDRADYIIDEIINTHGSSNKLFGIEFLFYTNTIRIYVISCDLADGNLYRNVSQKRVEDGFALYSLDACPIPTSASSLNRRGLQIDSSGSISSMTLAINPRLVGIQNYKANSNPFVLTANWGIDL